MRRFDCIVCIVTVALFGFVSVSEAGEILNVSSVSNCPAGNALGVALTAGTWVVTPVDEAGGGAYTAWNAWGGNVSGCDEDGTNCTNGWLTSYRIVSPDVPDDGYGGGTYETPELAFELEAEGTTFSLPANQTVNFYISDSNCGDNVGGVSLSIAEGAPTPTMPSVILMMLAAVVLVAGIWLLKRHAGPAVNWR